MEAGMAGYKTSQLDFKHMKGDEIGAALADIWGKGAASFGTFGLSNFVPDSVWNKARSAMTSGLMAGTGLGEEKIGQNQITAMQAKGSGNQLTALYQKLQIQKQQAKYAQMMPFAGISGGRKESQQAMQGTLQNLTTLLAKRKEIAEWRKSRGEGPTKEDLQLQQFQQMFVKPALPSKYGSPAQGAMQATQRQSAGVSGGSELVLDQVMENGDIRFVMKGMGSAFAFYKEQEARMTNTLGG
jgi:hypothetical protein